jgi:glycine cleavage system regulatory protein
MKTKVILSAVGSDRPGLTQALAEAVLGAGGNWLESHLSHLGGKYVGSVLVEVEQDCLQALTDAIGQIDASGLHVSMVAAGEATDSGGYPLSIEVVGQDRPGIVREVTAVLARLGANIEDFESSTQKGPWSGEPLFRAEARVRVPADVSFEQVQGALEAISAEIMVDLTVTQGADASAKGRPEK